MAAVTFEQARRAVAMHLAPHWRPELGTLTTLATGFQDAHYWRVMAGPRELLNQGDKDYTIVDFPALLVDKQNGTVEEVPIVGNWDRLAAMTPYGHATRR